MFEDQDALPAEPEKPFIPDVETNEGFRKRLEALTSGDKSIRLDPTRATVKDTDATCRKVESTMLTKFDDAELKALPEDSFPKVKAKERGPMLNSLEVIQQLDYKASEKKFEENTFTNIDFGNQAAPETLEEAEQMFMGKWQDKDTPAERERLHRLQVQREKEQYAEAVQQAIEGEKAKPGKADAELFADDVVKATPGGADVLPSNVKLVKKKKKAENSGDKPAKRPKTGKPKPSGGLGLVEY